MNAREYTARLLAHNRRSERATARAELLRVTGATVEDCAHCDGLGGWISDDGAERVVSCLTCAGCGLVEIETESDDTD